MDDRCRRKTARSCSSDEPTLIFSSFAVHRAAPADDRRGDHPALPHGRSDHALPRRTVTWDQAIDEDVGPPTSTRCTSSAGWRPRPAPAADAVECWRWAGGWRHLQDTGARPPGGGGDHLHGHQPVCTHVCKTKYPAALRPDVKLQGDLGQGIRDSATRVDVLVVNPPYVPTSRRRIATIRPRYRPGSRRSSNMAWMCSTDQTRAPCIYIG